MSNKMSNIDISLQPTTAYIKNETDNFPFRLLYAGLAIPKAGIWDIGRSDYTHYSIEYVLRGEGMLEINSFKYNLKAGDVFILQKHSNHYYYPIKKNPWQKLFFGVEGPLADHLMGAYNLSSEYYFPDCNTENLFKKILKLKQGKDIHKIAASLFNELLIKLFENKNKNTTDYGSGIIKIKEYLDTHVEEKISLKNISDVVSMSGPHVIRIFKKALGKTPYDYLLDKRMEYAELLLANSNIQIKEIASRLKFADEYYFSNFFKKKTGVSPRQFRKNKTGHSGEIQINTDQ
jgi:AraC-like DNA-binding protein